MSAMDTVLETLTKNYDTAMADGNKDEASIWKYCLDILNTTRAWQNWRASLIAVQVPPPEPEEAPEPESATLTPDPEDAPEPETATLTPDPEDTPEPEDAPEPATPVETKFYQRDAGETLVMVAPTRKSGFYKQQIERDTAFIFAETLHDRFKEGFARADAVKLGQEDFSLPDYKPLLIIRWLIDAGVVDAGNTRGKKMSFVAADLSTEMKAAWATLSEYASK